MKHDLEDGLTVSEAHITDAQQIAALQFVAGRPQYRGVLHDMLATSSVLERERLWTSRLSLEHGMDYFALVARAAGDSAILGFCEAGASRDQDKRGFGELYELSIDPNSEHTKVARALVNSAIDRLKEASFIGAHLWVEVGNADSIALYRSLGWTTDLERQDVLDSALSRTEARFETSWAFSSPH